MCTLTIKRQCNGTHKHSHKHVGRAQKKSTLNLFYCLLSSFRSGEGYPIAWKYVHPEKKKKTIFIHIHTHTYTIGVLMWMTRHCRYIFWYSYVCIHLICIDFFFGIVFRYQINVPSIPLKCNQQSMDGWLMMFAIFIHFIYITTNKEKPKNKSNGMKVQWKNHFFFHHLIVYLILISCLHTLVHIFIRVQFLRFFHLNWLRKLRGFFSLPLFFNKCMAISRTTIDKSMLKISVIIRCLHFICDSDFNGIFHDTHKYLLVHMHWMPPWQFITLFRFGSTKVWQVHLISIDQQNQFIRFMVNPVHDTFFCTMHICYSSSDINKFWP